MSGRDIGEWSGVCDDVPNTRPTIPCHCGVSAESSYSSITCRIINQLAFEKALSIFLFLYDLIVIIICLYWLITFWRHREMRAYKYSLKVRRPFYMILSYLLILPFIFEEGIATIYLFWANVIPSRNQQWDGVNWWTQYDGTPIYFGKTIDVALHFLYWFGFWSFFQLKIFKLWMLRYDYEYSKEMSNIEWKDHLGLRTVDPQSFFIRYRSILGNSFLMFFLQLVILIIIIFIQIFVRLVPLLQESASASTIEGIIILIISISEFIFIVWLMNQIREVNDNFYLKAESKRIFLASLIGGISWITGLIISSNATSISFIWVKCGTIILFTTWICVFCYFETIWVLKRIDYDWIKHTKHTHNKSHDNQNMKNMYLYLKLGDILQCQEGFEAMMRFLVGEFSCENLLCYVELSQYICTWGQQTIHNSINNSINNDIEEDCTLVNQMNIQLGSSSHQSSHQSSNGINSNIINGNGATHDRNGTIHDITANDNNHRSAQIKVEQFPYFENPEFEDELAHYEYIMQKYIYDSACLQINISGALRLEAQTVSPGMDNERIIKMINAIRSELWSLMRDSFTRFRSTTEYSKLADKLQHKSEFKWLFKNLHRRVDSPRNINNNHDFHT
eukprot:1009802_1